MKKVNVISYESRSGMRETDTPVFSKRPFATNTLTVAPNNLLVISALNVCLEIPILSCRVRTHHVLHYGYTIRSHISYDMINFKNFKFSNTFNIKNHIKEKFSIQREKGVVLSE